MCENQNQTVNATLQKNAGEETTSVRATSSETDNWFMKILWAIFGFIFSVHLYNSKGEALFKLVALLVSWIVGVLLQSTTVAYYLFSISIIMEYAVQLVFAHRFVTKILPLILVVSNVIVFAIASGRLYLQKEDAIQIQVILEIIAVSFIFADTLATLIFEPPESSRVESNIARRG